MNEYKVKEYPLQVEYTTSGGYFSKGWQPAKEFLEAVDYETLLQDEESKFTLEDVGYEVWRCVPDYEESGMVYFWPAQLGSPGAFPVTVVGG